MLVWTGQPPKPRQAIGGLIVQRYRLPSPEDLGPPRWFGVVGAAAIVLGIVLGTLTVLKALDCAWLTWVRFS
jgi:hypothetical protein